LFAPSVSLSTWVTVSTTAFEQGVDTFIGSVVGRLRNLGFEGTDLELLWADVTRERLDAELGQARRMEALLGVDAGEAEESLLDRVASYGRHLGRGAVEEIAAAARDECLQAVAAAEAQRSRAKTRVDVADRDTLLQASLPVRDVGPAPRTSTRALADSSRPVRAR
jgi:hypothetical protein